MQIKRAVGILSAILPIKAFAGSLEDRADLTFDYYADNTEVQVYSPSLSFLKKLTRKFLIGIKMRIDAITAASIRKGGAPAISDAVTGATVRRTYDDVRYAPSIFGVYDDGDNTLTVGAYYSTERDYTGRAVFLNYVRQLNLQNTAVGVGISRSSDIWDPIFKRNLPRKDRNELKVDLTLSQLLSPTAMIQAVYSYIRSEGFLGSPYHYLLTSRVARFESLPERRTGNALSLRLVKLINEPTSINLFYRYYSDDWKIGSHTIDLKVLRDIGRSLTAGIRLRYYTQSGAFFTKDPEDYTYSDQYVAVDYRLSSFNSQTFGILFLKELWVRGLSLKGAVNYYTTSPNKQIRAWFGKERIQAWFGTLNLSYSF